MDSSVSTEVVRLPEHTLQVENMNDGRVDLRIRNRYQGTMAVVKVDLGEFNRALAKGRDGVEVPVELVKIT